MILGGVGVVVVIIVLVMMNSGKGGDDDSSSKKQPAAPAKQPVTPKTQLKVSGAQAGKAPEKPAPALTAETLAKMRDQYAAAKVLGDEGIRLRKEGKNKECGAKMSEAKRKIDAIKAMVEPQLRWQEEADFGDWAQPGEYVTMANIYAKLARLEKTVRMNGGK